MAPPRSSRPPLAKSKRRPKPAAPPPARQQRRSSLPPRQARPAPPARAAPPSPPPRPAGDVLEDEEATLLDLIDNLLNRGVVLNGEVILGVAGVDLVYLRLSALLAAADRVLPQSAATNRRAAAARAEVRPSSPLMLPSGRSEPGRR